MHTPPRHAWIDSDLDVVIVAGESTVKAHPHYAAAKSGSVRDAWALVAETMPMTDLRALASVIKDGSVLIAVHAFEKIGTNKIPDAMAA